MALSSADEFTVSCIKENIDHMAAELLADSVLVGEDIEADLTKTVAIGDKEVVISVKKA